MVVFAATKGKKDDQHEDKEPPKVHGGVQGESRHGSTTGETDIECWIQDARKLLSSSERGGLTQKKDKNTIE